MLFPPEHSRPQPSSRAPSNSRASFLSPSPSFDADDEGSASSMSHMHSDHEPLTHSRAPRYPGEDTRLTSAKELTGWYSYGWAAEVFAICGVGSFIPITLESLARERGVLLSDRTTPCVGNKSHAENGQCVVHLFGTEINTASFAMYTFSLSVLLQALVIISMSGAADHGRYRKRLLLSFAMVGSVATMLFLPIGSEVYLLAAVLAIISNTCFGASFVLLNSFLPLLVRHHPSVQPVDSLSPSPSRRSLPLEEGSQTEEDSLLDSTAGRRSVSQTTTISPTPPSTSSAALRLSTHISSYGIGIGYMAGVSLQIIAILILVALKSTTFALRLVLFLIGLWWLLFTLPAALYLRPRPGPPLLSTHAASAVAYVSYAWRSLGHTIMRARHLKDVVIFLFAWFLLSDALATVSSTAILFAKTDLDMPAPALAFISVIGTLTGVVGAFAWPRVSRLFGLRPIQTIAVCIALFELIPLYGLLGYIPAIRRLGFLGLQQDWEMYVLGAIYGFVLAGLGSYCRALFGELVPPGSEAAFYALYAITDKGSSVFGPAVVGAITDRWGEIRPAFLFLAVLVGLPLPLVLLVDTERGKKDAAVLARELLGKDVGGRGRERDYEEVEAGEPFFPSVDAEEGGEEQSRDR